MSNDKHKNKYQDKRGKALPDRSDATSRSAALRNASAIHSPTGKEARLTRLQSSAGKRILKRATRCLRELIQRLRRGGSSKRITNALHGSV